MEQLSLFPELEILPRNLLNLEGVDLFNVPRLDFTTKDPALSKIAREKKQRKISLLDDVEEGKFILYPTGGKHPLLEGKRHFFGDDASVNSLYESRGEAFPFVYNTKSKKNVSIRLSRCKYPVFGVRTLSGHQIDLMAHEIFAIAFLDNTDPERFYSVDHIDQDVLNYSIDNLAWTTPGENQKKAFANAKDEKAKKEKAGDGVLRREV